MACRMLVVGIVSIPLFAQPSLHQRDERYRLQSSDVLEVHYRYTPEFDQTVTILTDGFISLNLVGSLKIGGLTLEDARTMITEKSATRLRDPEVSLILKDYVKPQFAVAGEVERPGKFELRGPTTAVEAIAMAGGFKSASAKHSQVILYRRFDSESAETKILDMKRIMRAKGLGEDVQLQSGDMLIVPQNRISKIERFVKWTNVGMYWNPLP